MNYIEVGHFPMCELTPGAEYRHIGDEQKIVYEQLPACMSQALPQKYRNKMVILLQRVAVEVESS